MEAAFFDLDKTVIARASMAAFGRSFHREGLIGRRTLVRAIYAQVLYLWLGADEERLEKIRDSVLALTRGWDQGEVRRIVAEALSEVVEPITYREALDLMAAHRAAGRLVVIVSASPEEVVEPLARWLGADRTIATKARVDDEGRYTGEVDRYAFGPFKPHLMRELAEAEGIDLSTSWAYSDSATDIPMLEAVGHPVAVNPDRPLRRHAELNGWELRTFKDTVALRTRRPVSTAAIPAAGVAALAAGAALWWARSRRGPAVAGPPGRADW